LNVGPESSSHMLQKYVMVVNIIGIAHFLSIFLIDRHTSKQDRDVGWKLRGHESPCRPPWILRKRVSVPLDAVGSPEPERSIRYLHPFESVGSNEWSKRFHLCRLFDECIGSDQGYESSEISQLPSLLTRSESYALQVQCIINQTPYGVRS
jgi:hypothetical protein